MSDEKTISSPTHLVDQVSQRLEKKKESGEIPRMSETLDFSVFSESRGQQGDGLEVKLIASQDSWWKSEKKLSGYVISYPEP